MFLSVAAVSAQDNTTSEIGLNENTATIDAGEIVEENLKVEPKEDSPIASEAEGKDDDVNVANVEMNEDNLKAPGSSFKDLQKLINDAKPGAVITLDKDYSYSPGNSEIVINKRITIDGKNHVLDGKLSTKILNITGNHVTLKNIKFINANITNDYDGGAIYWNGTYGKMSSCSFVNNHAESGSAVKWDGEYGNMSSCSFVNNHANYWGGAVNWWGDNGLLSACSFTNNHAGEHGGAISLSGENCTLSACSFTNNHANGFGGAVNLGNSYNVLKDCSFVNNRADRFGGAVAWDGDYGLLSACSFTNNHAEYYGGAVYWPGYNGTLEVCSFNNNHVNYDGGAVYWEADNGALSSCYFVNNHANDRGGAVAWDGDNGLLSYCSFVNNSAKYYGDAIYLYKNNTDVSACFFVIYRPKNTAVVKVDNLIYYRDSDYGVYYYENGNEIQSGLINDGYVTFYNLDNGKHEITMKFDKDGTEFTNYLTITGDSYLSASKVYMFYNDGTKYTIKLTNYKGNPLIYQNIQITIANKKYDIQTDSKGYATLTLKQKAGKYKVIASFNGNSEYGPSTIVTTLNILDSPITKNKNLKIYFRGGTFRVRIINVYGKHVGAGKIVKFTIAGKTYIKKTNKNGYASLKIKLKPKTYTIVTKYGKFVKKNKITVKPVLTAKNIIKKKRKTIKFYVKLVSIKGKPLTRKTVRFRFRGKTYKIKTNKKGIATLKIKNLKKGKYNLYTQYGKAKITNSIKIK